MTCEIPLTRGKTAVIDECDLPLVAPYVWTTSECRGHWRAVRYVTVDGARVIIFMHRLILDAPADKLVDHVDGDGLNNRRANLRLCSRAENQRNMHARRSACGFKGVSHADRGCQLRRPWLALISVDGKRLHLGYFETAEAAALAYDKAATQHYGEFANLNYPEAPQCSA